MKSEEKAAYLRFQEKNHYDSFTYPKSGFALEGKMKTCIIKRKNGRYYACLVCEVETKPSQTGGQVGIDLGVRYLITTSDGEHRQNHQYLRQSERKIKYLQRMVSRRKKGSNRRRKAIAMLAKAWNVPSWMDTGCCTR